MFNKVRENHIIIQIQKEMKKDSLLKYLALNAIKDKAVYQVLNNKISDDFYKNVFCGGNINNHYSKVNYDYIMNYFERK